MKNLLKGINYKTLVINLIFETIGSFLISVALYNFANTANFAMSGFSGISLLIYRLSGFPIGVSTILLNIPVAILCYKLLGKGFLIRSLRALLISSLMIDYLAPLLPVYEGDAILAMVCTGIIGGLGYAMIYMRNSSTGGSDFIVMAIKSKLPYLSLGKIIFLSDVLIVVIGGLAIQNIDGIIYGLIINYLYSLVVDKLLYGINSGKLALIITVHAQEIYKIIDKSLARGATIIDAKGAYKLEHKEVILCACSNKEMYTLEQEIKAVDKQAFIIILESNEVIGEGFKNLKIAQAIENAELENNQE